MFLRILPPLLAVSVVTSCSMLPQGSPLVVGAKPHDFGKIGAGEGPAWKDGVLYFTDGRGINQLELDSGKTGVHRSNCGSPNGLMFDQEGRMIRCESQGRRVVREEHDGSLTVLAERFEGHRFNSPNDLTMDSRGRIYFTDPRYGPRDTMEMRIEGVYRINRPAKLPPGLCSYAYDLPNVTRILGPEDVERPNGILVSPGDRFLYVADNNNNTRGGSRKLLRFELDEEGHVMPGSRRVIFDWKDGRGPDGLKMDRAGRLYVAAGVNQPTQWETDEFKAGCYILTPRGRLLDFVPTSPDEATNCAFGGRDMRTLFITSGNHLWSVPLKTAGWKVSP